MTVGAQIIAETTLLAEAIKRAPHAKVRKYPSWDLAQLGRHVGEIHGWATGIVRSQSTERVSRAKLTDVPADEVAGVLHIGAVALAEVLDACDPAGPVWGFAGDGTNAFWRRRMLLETTVHRWDAQDAIGGVTVVPHEVAVDGIDESLSVHVRANLPGGWTVEADGPSLSVSDGTTASHLAGGAVDLWLFVMGRGSLAGLDVEGDAALASEFATMLREARGPA